VPRRAAQAGARAASRPATKKQKKISAAAQVAAVRAAGARVLVVAYEQWAADPDLATANVYVSDPVLALRRLHGALKPGGVLFAETAVTANRAAPGAPPLVEYWGAARPGYSRDVPEPRALRAWLADAGFEDVRVTDGGRPRSLAAARKPKTYADFLRAGFAIPDLC